MGIGLAVLCALGAWQVKRLVWKEQLIETVEGRINSEPVSLSKLTEAGFDKSLHEYLPVAFSGTFDHSREVYFFTTGKGGSSGWHIHVPIEFEEGRFLIVNRGFVPFDLKQPEKRSAGLVNGAAQYTALLRFPLSQRPFGSLENNIAKREFYWRSITEMSKAMGLDPELALPVIADLKAIEVPGGWPQGGSTIVSFPNNHLQYAVTWFGLALTLLGVGSYFLYSRRQSSHD